MFIQQKDQILRGCIFFCPYQKMSFCAIRANIRGEKERFFRTFIHFVPFSIQDTNEAIVIADIIGSLAREESATKINAFAALLKHLDHKRAKISNRIANGAERLRHANRLPFFAIKIVDEEKQPPQYSTGALNGIFMKTRKE